MLEPQLMDSSQESKKNGEKSANELLSVCQIPSVHKKTNSKL